MENQKNNDETARADLEIEVKQIQWKDAQESLKRFVLANREKFNVSKLEYLFKGDWGDFAKNGPDLEKYNEMRDWLLPFQTKCNKLERRAIKRAMKLTGLKIVTEVTPDPSNHVICLKNDDETFCAIFQKVASGNCNELVNGTPTYQFHICCSSESGTKIETGENPHFVAGTLVRFYNDMMKK